MTLRAQPPTAIKKRLKLFIYSDAGVGKTTAALQFPKAYIIDAERGAENYAAAIAASGSVILQTTLLEDVITEVRSLLSERHDYQTLIIDPVTTLYDTALDAAGSDSRIGTEHGRHYGAVGKQMKRLLALIAQLDMNVIVTAHQKVEYGEKMQMRPLLCFLRESYSEHIEGMDLQYGPWLNARGAD